MSSLQDEMRAGIAELAAAREVFQGESAEHRRVRNEVLAAAFDAVSIFSEANSKSVYIDTLAESDGEIDNPDKPFSCLTQQLVNCVAPGGFLVVRLAVGQVHIIDSIITLYGRTVYFFAEGPTELRQGEWSGEGGKYAGQFRGGKVVVNDPVDLVGADYDSAYSLSRFVFVAPYNMDGPELYISGGLRQNGAPLIYAHWVTEFRLVIKGGGKSRRDNELLAYQSGGGGIYLVLYSFPGVVNSDGSIETDIASLIGGVVRNSDGSASNVTTNVEDF